MKDAAQVAFIAAHRPPHVKGHGRGTELRRCEGEDEAEGQCHASARGSTRLLWYLDYQPLRANCIHGILGMRSTTDVLRASDPARIPCTLLARM